ncbi:MAG: alpha/beta hydrolase [Gemmatimonadetes bacterium]|nr:alpha/beta hydrolase [Gemmatimonadota bacterium]
MGLGRKLIGGAMAATAVAAAAARALRATPPEPPAPPAGDPRRYGWRHAEIFLAARGQGPPALLLHDLYTGASGLEMEPLANRLAGEWTVHLADLPGFGRSGRPAMRFGPDLFFDAIVELVRHSIDEPTVLVGSGLSAAYAVEAAVRLGDAVRGVVLLAPPEPEGPGVIERPTWRPLAYQLLRSPFGEAYHALHAARRWRRHALSIDLAAEPADLDERADELHRLARQPDSHWALWSLWVGDLAWDPRPALSRLGAPALALWSAEARTNPAAPETYRAVRPDLPQQVVPGTGRWPHVDAPPETAEAMLAWWDRVSRPVTDTAEG